MRIEPGDAGSHWTATVDDRTLTRSSAAALRGPLTRTLYDVLHAGRRQDTTRSRSLRDPAFEKRLADAAPHRTTTAPARVIEAANRPGETIVELAGIRLAIPAETIRTTRAPQPGDTVTVELPAARPALSPGFFLIDSSRGRPRRSPLLRLYVHVAAPDSAPHAWHEALSLLESKHVPYRAKILSSPRAYPRTDSLVIYLGPDAWHLAADLSQTLGNLPGSGAATSVFARRLAPGVAMAWEPADNLLGRTRPSYGQHRSAALTDALIQHATVDGTTASLDAAVHEALAHAGIDPLAPERDIDSPEPDLAR
ncbi:T3SS effector HopA1 family protein [Streptomyces wuyuanensis]|uniref:T3SS effector HopA1 family protein n=1 Tax=Streptomyces wuyuanensis TaxID=1196353 RepID=UPI003440C236